jgi:hypothetical protein
MTLYRDTKGLFHFGTNDFPPELLAKFSEKLLELLQEHDALADAFFVHELRGTKGAYCHDLSNENERKAALEGIFHLRWPNLYAAPDR